VNTKIKEGYVMSQEMENLVSRNLHVELLKKDGEPEKKTFVFTSEEGTGVRAGTLKQNFLTWFEDTSPVLEKEQESDENRTFHLLGYEPGKDRGTAFRDGDTVDLSKYTQFQISHRTAGGGRSCHGAPRI
jgi:hypothetical protein